MAAPTVIQENRDELLRIGKARINNTVYIISEEVPEKGDLVIDCKDVTYSKCDMIIGDKMALTDENGFSAELGVPFSRVLKLIPEVQEF